MRRYLILSVLLTSLYSMAAFALSGTFQITPANIGSHMHTFALQKQTMDGNQIWTLTIYPKENDSKHSFAGTLQVCNGKTNLIRCTLAQSRIPAKSIKREPKLSNAIQYVFTVDDSLIENASITIADTPIDSTGFPFSSADGYVFQLKDFVGQTKQPATKASP